MNKNVLSIYFKPVNFIDKCGKPFHTIGPMEANEECSNCNALKYALLIFCLVLDPRDLLWPGTDGNSSLSYTGALFCIHLYVNTVIL